MLYEEVARQTGHKSKKTEESAERHERQGRTSGLSQVCGGSGGQESKGGDTAFGLLEAGRSRAVLSFGH